MKSLFLMTNNCKFQKTLLDPATAISYVYRVLFNIFSYQYEYPSESCLTKLLTVGAWAVVLKSASVDSEGRCLFQVLVIIPTEFGDGRRKCVSV